MRGYRLDLCTSTRCIEKQTRNANGVAEEGTIMAEVGEGSDDDGRHEFLGWREKWRLCFKLGGSINHKIANGDELPG